MIGLIRHLTLPGTLAHELSHALAGVVWAERVGIEVEPRGGGARATVDWRGDPSDVAIATVAIAPAIAGVLTGVLAVAQWLSLGAPTPDTTFGWATWSVLAMWWAAFVGNPNDVRRAVRALQGGET